MTLVVRTGDCNEGISHRTALLTPEPGCGAIALRLQPCYNLAELGRYFRIYDRLMAHWRALLPDFVLDLSYAALVADQEGESRRLLEFCGLEWDDAVLDYQKAERSVSTASAAHRDESLSMRPRSAELAAF